MSGFLLDTDAISMLAPGKAVPDGFLAWLDRSDADGLIFLSAVTIHELEKGVALLEHKGATGNAAALRAWLDGLVSAYNDRLLPIDASVAARAGRLEAAAIVSGHDPGMADALVAATAGDQGLTVVTRNVRHFQAFGAALLHPEDCRP